MGPLVLSPSKYERGAGQARSSGHTCEPPLDPSAKLRVSGVSGNHCMAFYVYILECSDGSYYTGHTDDLERRLNTHNSGELDAYTKNRRPLTLVFLQEFTTRDEAFAAERQIKGWARKKKEAIIRDRWDLLPNLARTSLKKGE